jgi:glucose-1-phosphate cytidylyltransferase
MLDTCLVLAGGRGTRLSEKTGELPKPMLPIGDRPIIQHIIDFYVTQGITNFVIPVGYLGNKIFQYFADQSDIIFEEHGCTWTALCVENDKCKVTVVYTGHDTLTGTRIALCRDYLPTKFHFTYGDGVSDIDLKAVELDHLLTGAEITISAVHPEPRFGSLQISHDGYVTKFGEKKDNLGYVNGGFGIMSQRVLDRIEIAGDNVNMEAEVFPEVASDGKMIAVKHEGFWLAIDTIRDLERAEECYKQNLFL